MTDNKLSASKLSIKIIDKKRMISVWNLTNQNNTPNYYVMTPLKMADNFPIMEILATEEMDDNDVIFDKIDYNKL